MLKTIGLVVLFFLFVLIVRVLGTKKPEDAAKKAAEMFDSSDEEDK